MRGRPRHHDFCGVHGCQARHYAKGMCQRHYRQVQRRVQGASVAGASCVVLGCTVSKFSGSKLCLAHSLEREFHERGGDKTMLPEELR